MIGVVLIGDEILGAQVRDENMYVILQRLGEIGYPAGEVRVIKDNHDVIASTIREVAGRYELVFTAGGIGPTHDDITVEAVAAAFGVPLEENPKMRSFLERRYGPPLTPMVAGMARLPPEISVEGCEKGHWPVIRFRNIYILPGLPRALRDKIDRIVNTLPRRPVRWSGSIFLGADESEFADDLDGLQRGMSDVSVGSYPVYGPYEYRSRISVSGIDESTVRRAFGELRTYFLDRGMIVREDPPESRCRVPANEGKIDE